MSEARFLGTATDEVLRLRDQLASGGNHVIGFGHPRYEPGERFAMTLQQIQRRRVARTADGESLRAGEFADDRGKLRTEGTLYLTDRRAVLMGNFRKQLAEWRWTDLADVKVLRAWAGVRFMANRDDEVDDAAVHVYRRAVVVDMPERQVALRLIRAEATFVMCSGRDLDAWLARLPERLG